MDKSAAQEQIRAIAAQAGLSSDETLAAVTAPQSPGTTVPFELRQLSMAEILYYIGGAIVYLGLAIFVYQNWSSLDFVARISASLGAGVLAYLAGALMTSSKLEGLGNAFHLIGALTLPIGLGVLFDHFGFHIYDWQMPALIALILTALYGASYVVFRRGFFMFFTLMFGSWCFYTAGMHYFQPVATYNSHVSEYLFLTLGLVYMFLAYAFSKNTLNILAGVLYAFGSLFILGSTFALGGAYINTNVYWEMAYPFIVFATLFLSIYAHSKAMLVFATLSLMVFIFKITGEYFSQGLGWPISLVIAGLLIMGTGVLSVYLNQKYLKR